MTRAAATQRSFQELIKVEPVIGRVAHLAEFLPGDAHGTLFHAGPPFAAPDAIPAPVRNAAAIAAIHEGLAETREEALSHIANGAIKLVPAQDAGLVTPLAFVVSLRMFCLEIIDANQPDRRWLSPLNDGPLPDALRFGTGSRAGLALLKCLDTSVGPDLAQHFPSSAPVLPLLAAGLAGGDDLHGHVAATQAAFLDLFGDAISSDTRTYMSEANQFVLNVIMATAALMLKGASGIVASNLVVAAGGNGVDFGYKLADAPDTWITGPATCPEGARFPGKDDANVLPAVGDSAVIDALGFGAACLRFCPTLSEALRGKIDPSFLTPAAHEPYVGAHPVLAATDLHLGLDLTRPRRCLGIMLGMVEAGGSGGLIGRGVAPWPAN